PPPSSPPPSSPPPSSPPPSGPLTMWPRLPPPNQILVIEVYVVIFDKTYVESVDIVSDILLTFKSKVSAVIGIPVSQIFISKIYKNGTDISNGLVDRRRILMEQQQQVLQQNLVPYYRNDKFSPEEMIHAATIGNIKSNISSLTRTQRFFARNPAAAESALEAFERVLLHSLDLVVIPSGRILRRRNSIRNGDTILRKLMTSIPTTSDNLPLLSSGGDLAIEFYTKNYVVAPSPLSPPSPPPRPSNPPGVQDPPSPPTVPMTTPSSQPLFTTSSFIQGLGASAVYQYKSPPPSSPPPASPPPSSPPPSSPPPASPPPTSPPPSSP
ncbi:hypothetical protein VaNZ11_009356, partial [Volvox africanus]